MKNADAWHLTQRFNSEFGKGDPFVAAIQATRMPMVITDPRLDDNPIVLVNDAFCGMTGYERSEIIGRNCRFLQGADTDPEAVAQVRQALSDRTDIEIDLLNYRKDGTPFWNALHISPVLNEDGELQNFVASQLDVTERRAALATEAVLLHEVDHRVNNNLQVISALLAMEAKAIPDPDGARRLRATLGRVEALSIAHRGLFQSDDVTRFDVAEVAQDIATRLVNRTGRRDVGVRLALEPASLPASLAAPLALIVNELVAKSLKHAFPQDRSGLITIEVARTDGGLRLAVADDGIGVPRETAATRSFGRKLVNALSHQLGATTTWGSSEPSGLRVELHMPLKEQHSLQTAS